MGNDTRSISLSLSLSLYSRSVRDREVWDFTHEDVKNGVIHFAPDPRDARRILDRLKKEARGGGGGGGGGGAKPAAVSDKFMFR